MAANAVIRSRIGVEVNNKVTAVLERMGLMVSGVMRIALTRVANENALPFDMKLNNLTRETMQRREPMCIRPRMPPISLINLESDALAELFKPISPRREAASEKRNRPRKAEDADRTSAVSRTEGNKLSPLRSSAYPSEHRD